MTEERELLQGLVDALYYERKVIDRLDVVLRAESSDLPEELLEIIALLPPGTYVRQALCDQFNSSMKGHGWTRRFGTVD